MFSDQTFLSSFLGERLRLLRPRLRLRLLLPRRLGDFFGDLQVQYTLS
jgi:hypothetical protein